MMILTTTFPLPQINSAGGEWLIPQNICEYSCIQKVALGNLCKIEVWRKL